MKGRRKKNIGFSLGRMTSFLFILVLVLFLMASGRKEKHLQEVGDTLFELHKEFSSTGS